MEFNNKNNNIIGVMDSGVGGLTVLKQMLELCPNEKYIYFGDTKNLPYGEKTKDELVSLSKRIFDFYQAQNAKAVIMACNTTSATVYDELKNNYDFKIYPVIQTVAKIIANEPNTRRIAIMATQATVKSGKYKQELTKYNPNLSVFEQACPLWVPLVEKKLINYNTEDIIKSYLNEVLEFSPDKIILGCTHYPYLLDELQKYAPKEIFINPAMIFAQHIKNDLKANNLLSNREKGTVDYYASANPKEFKENATLFMNINKIPELACL